VVLSSLEVQVLHQEPAGPAADLAGLHQLVQNLHGPAGHLELRQRDRDRDRLLDPRDQDWDPLLDPRDQHRLLDPRDQDRLIPQNPGEPRVHLGATKRELPDDQ